MALSDYYVGWGGRFNEIAHAVPKSTPKPVKNLGATRTQSLCGAYVNHYGHEITFELVVRLRSRGPKNPTAGQPTVCSECRKRGRRDGEL